MAKYHSSYVGNSPYFRKTAAMPSPRRLRIFSIMVFIAIVAFLLWSTSHGHQQISDLRSGGDFYEKTLNALDEKNLDESKTTVKAGSEDDKEEVSRAMSERLKEAALVAKDKANKKAPKPDNPSHLVGVGSAAEGARDEKSVAGRKKFQPLGPQEPVKEEKEKDLEAEKELNNILKKSPVIIFSKSYCPHSRRAKGILTEKYIIDPAPFVVELDLHPLGARLQALLGETTKRRTVPNVLVSGVSIGGGDDVAELDAARALAEKVKKLGGKKILEAKQRPIADDSHGLR